MMQPIDPINLIRANLVWDLIDHENVPDVLEALGMVPPGDDGMMLACEDSHLRTIPTDPLNLIFLELGQELARIYLAAILGDTAAEVPKEHMAIWIAQYGVLIGQATKVAVSHLMANGILAYNVGEKQ